MSTSASKSSANTSTSSTSIDRRIAADGGSIVVGDGSHLEVLSDDVALASMSNSSETARNAMSLAATVNDDALSANKAVVGAALDSVSEANHNQAALANSALSTLGEAADTSAKFAAQVNADSLSAVTTLAGAALSTVGEAADTSAKLAAQVNADSLASNQAVVGAALDTVTENFDTGAALIAKNLDLVRDSNSTAASLTTSLSEIMARNDNPTAENTSSAIQTAGAVACVAAIAWALSRSK